MFKIYFYVSLLLLSLALQHKKQSFSTRLSQTILMQLCSDGHLVVGNHNEIQLIHDEHTMKIISFNSSLQQVKCLNNGLIAIATASNFYLYDHMHNINSSLYLEGNFPMAISENPHKHEVYLLTIKNKTTFQEFIFENYDVHDYEDEDLDLGMNIMAVKYIDQREYIYVTDYERNLNIYHQPFRKQSGEVLRMQHLTAPAHMSSLRDHPCAIVYDNSGNFAIVHEGKITKEQLRTRYHQGAICSMGNYAMANNLDLQIHVGNQKHMVNSIGITADLKDMVCEEEEDGEINVFLLDVVGRIIKVEIETEKQKSASIFTFIVIIAVLAALIYFIKQKCFSQNVENQEMTTPLGGEMDSYGQGGIRP